MGIWAYHFGCYFNCIGHQRIMFKVPIPGIDENRLIENSLSQAGQDLFVIAMFQGAKNKTFLEIGAGNPTAFGSNTYLLEKEFDYSGVSIDLFDRGGGYYSKKIAWTIFYNNVKDINWPEANSFEELPLDLQKECLDIHEYSAFVGDFDDDWPAVVYDWPNERPRTKFHQTDALEFDYSLVDDYFDYLQIDIDPAWNNWLALEKITKSKEFAIITYEHDLWRKTPESQQAKKNGQQLLTDLGYVLVADDVTCSFGKGFGIKNEPLYFEDWYANPKYVDQKIIDSYKCLGTGRPKYYTEILFKG